MIPRRVIGHAFFLILFLVACDPSTARFAETQSPTIAFTLTSPAPGLSPTPFTSTPTLSPSDTPTHSPPLPPTQPPTLTPAPTLSRQEAYTLVADLLKNNGGCRLPCWWGMVPGKSSWRDDSHFLETFVDSIQLQDETQFERNGQNIEQAYYIVRFSMGGNTIDGFSLIVDNGTIAEIFTGPPVTQPAYRLDQILTSFGSPDEIYIKTYRYTSIGGPPPFDILLTYNLKHFWVWYILDGEIKENVIRACPQTIGPYLLLGSADSNWKIEDYLGYAPIPSNLYRMPLTVSEATGMGLKEFTEIFKEANNQKCIETSVDLWF